MFSRFIFVSVLGLALSTAVHASSADQNARGTQQASTAVADQNVRATQAIPAQFGGWQVAGPIHSSADPADADPTNAAVLKEYGFTDFESASYRREDGRTLTLKTARFADASGAYGAF